MDSPAQSPFDEQFYSYVSGGLSAEAADAYRERLKSDDELAWWAALLQGFVDGCLGPIESDPDRSDSSASADDQREPASNTWRASDAADETLDPQRLDSLSRALHRTDMPPVALAWQRLTRSFGTVERQAYWDVIVERRPLPEVASRLHLSDVDVEIYVSQVGRQLARELEST